MPRLPPRIALRFSAYLAGFLGIALARWIGRSFGQTSLEQILWHLRYSEGAAVRMGRLFLDSIGYRDYPVVMGILMFSAAMVLIGSLLADILYAVVDPRIRVG